jgi:peptidoglycan/LPS O-acetylase OafA/YrhL
LTQPALNLEPALETRPRPADPGVESWIAFRAAKRIPELDGLRGVAIGLVIINHYFSDALAFRLAHPLAILQVPTRLTWSGVDLFFVLSGFLIGGILLDAKDSSNYFKVFYVRRTFRILPIYLVLVGLAFLGAHFLPSAKYPLTRPYLVNLLPWYAYLTFTQNIWSLIWNVKTGVILGVTWSLAVEEQFYLTLPSVIRFLRRSLLPYVFCAGILCAFLLRVALLLRFPRSLSAPQYLLPCRMDSLLMGALAAYMLRKQQVWCWLVARRKWLWRIFGVLFLGLAYFLAHSLPTSVPTASIGYDWLAFFYLMALVLAVTDNRSFLGRALRWRWLMGLGTIAYCVYLIHLPVYFATFGLILHKADPRLATFADLAVSLLALALTIGIAKISWRFFEKPLVRFGHSLHYKNENEF